MSLEIALQAHQQGNLSEARRLYELFLESDPKHPDALYLLGILLRQSGEFEGALTHLESAAAEAPENANILYNLAHFYFESGAIQKSIQTYERILQFHPDHISTLNNLGSIYLSEQPENSLRLLQRSFELDPTSLQTLCNLSLSLDAAGRKLDALELLRQNFSPWKDELQLNNVLSAVLFEIEPGSLNPLQVQFLESLYTNPHLHGTRLNQALRPRFLALCAELIRIGDFHHIPPLIADYLRSDTISSAREEYLFVQLRKNLLLNFRALISREPEGLESLVESMAVQAMTLEYCPLTLPMEELELKNYEGDSKWEVLIRSCYRHPLEQDLKIIEVNSLPNLAQVLKRELDVAAIPIEQSSIYRETSKLVRSQYEEDPYPRWAHVQKFSPTSIYEFLNGRIHSQDLHQTIPNDPEILIAGCGTGKVLMELLSQIHYQSAIGIDLSIRSLQYTAYKIQNSNLGEVKLKQLDILDLEKLDRRFDFIDCCGVLHHMEDPDQGLKSLLKVLKEKAFMRLALYSRRARRHINLAREKFSNMKPTAQNISKARQSILGSDARDPLHGISYCTDFYSLSGCRDLLFHSCEHQYDLLEIKEWLMRNDLIFCGFEFPSKSILQAYRSQYPNDPRAVNLENWHQFEAENPDFFCAMYQFFVRKNN